MAVESALRITGLPRGPFGFEIRTSETERLGPK